MKWFQVKEYSAGKFRLIVTWCLYKFFGRKVLNILIFFITLFTFIFSKDLRSYSKKYLKEIYHLTQLKPSLLNQFKHVYNYALTLGDKLEIFSEKYSLDNLIFESEKDKNELYDSIDSKKGAIFLCSHLGSIDVFKVLIQTRPGIRVNIITSYAQSKVFNAFLEKINKITQLNFFDVENIGIETSIILKDELDKGNIIFLSGDRVSQNMNSSTFVANFLGHNVKFPLGCFKLVQLMEVPIFFISAIKNSEGKYIIYSQKYEYSSLKNLENSFVKYLEKMVLLDPLQFYHFYDIFE